MRVEYLDSTEDISRQDGEEGQRTVTPNSVCPPHDAGVRREDSSRGALKSVATTGEDKIKAKSEGGDKGMSTAGSMARSSPAPPSETASDPSPPTRGEWASFASPSEAADFTSASGANGNNANGNSTNGASTGTNRSRRRRTVDIPCDSIVIAAGCWTPRVYRALFPSAGRIPRVTALAGHSLVLRSPRCAPDAAPAKEPAIAGTGTGTGTPAPPRLCHAIFTGDHAGYSPELFARASGELWLGGHNSSSLPLPALANGAQPDPDAIAALLHTARALCGADVDVVRAGLCFRPVAPTGRPVLARMHEADLGDGARVAGGVFVATGHGPWGISLSLGTGYVVSEMVLGREPSVDVKALGRWEAQAP